MLGALLFCPQPRGALLLGSGGGTIDRFIAAHLPRLPLTSVEANPAMIELTRRYFFLPNDWPVICDRAAAQLARHATPCDLLLCDLFDDDHHPNELFDARVYRDAARLLGPNGVLVINLLPNEQALRTILTLLRQHLPWVVLLEFPDQRNIVVYASHAAPPDDEQLRQRAHDANARWQLDLRSRVGQLLRLPRAPLAG